MSINATPFNPTFKLVGNLQEDQVLVYNTSEGAFINAAGTSSAGGAGLDSVSHTGAGNQLGSITGSSLVLQTITAGTNVTITDSGNGLIISADLSTNLQSGTNLGSGSALLSGIDSEGTFSFKSIAGGNGIIVADDGETITLSANIDTTQFLVNSNNLSDVPNKSLARTNIGAISQADSDARYMRLNANNAPTIDDTFNLGSSDFRYNDIYAKTLHGTAVLADNLTVVGSNNGDVLTWNGSTWVSAPAGAGQNEFNATPQTLVINGQTLSITGGNSITLPSPVDVDNFIKTDGHSLPNLNKTWDIGSSDYRFNDIYAETFYGTAILANNLSVNGEVDEVLTYNGAAWVAGPKAYQELTWDGNVLSITDGNSVSLNLGNYVTTTALTTAIDNIDIPYADWNTLQNKPTLPTDISDLTDTTNLLVTAFSGVYNDLTGAPTIPTDVSDLTDTTNLLNHVTAFSGDYNDLTNKPTISESFSGAYADLTGSPTDISAFTDTTNLLAESQVLSFSNNLLSISSGNSIDLSEYANVDAQQITLNGTELTISGGNTIDLSSLATTVDLSPYATQDYVINSIGILESGLFSGSYNDLTDTPTIPTIPTDVSAFTNDSGYLTAHQDLTDYTLKTEAFSGSYNDLTDTPTIPTIPTNVSAFTNDSGYLTSYTDTTYATATAETLGLVKIGYSANGTNYPVELNGEEMFVNVPWTDTNVDTTYTAGNGLELTGTEFSLDSTIANKAYVDNAISNLIGGADAAFDTFKEIQDSMATDAELSSAISNLSIPTNVSQLSNDSGYLTSHQDLSDYALKTEAFSGSYNDLTDTPTIPEAFSGSYDDLTDTPTIPEAFSGVYSDLTGAPTDISELTDTTNLLVPESQLLTLANNLVTISGGNSVDLSEYVNTDEQVLSLNDKTLTISGGNSVDLSSLVEDVDLTQYATQDYVVNTINSLGDSDGQELTFSGTILSISSGSGNGNSVDLVSLVDAATDLTGYATEQWVDDKLAARLDADYQNLSIAEGKLFISNGNSIELTDLGAFIATQSLSISGNEITISDGNSITLPVYNDVDNYIKLDGHSAPSEDNLWDIGSAELRFNDVYGERFHGTAVLSDNLTLEGDIGDVLTYNGTTWVAAAPTGGDGNGGGGGEGIPQTLALVDTDLTISGGNTVDLSGLGIDGLTSNLPTTTLALDASWNFVPEINNSQHLGSDGRRWKDIHVGEVKLAGNTLAADSANDVTWNGNKLAKLSDIPAPQNLTYTHDTKTLEISTGNSVDLTELYTVNISDTAPTAPLDGELWFDSANFALLINYDLGGFPFWIELNPQSSSPDYQNLTLDGTTLTIANGNSVDLSGLGGGGGSNYTDADVKSYLNGGWDFDLIPSTNAGFNIGSPTNMVKDLYISDTTIYFGSAGNTLKTAGTTLLFNDEDLKDYANLINKPAIPQDISDLTDSTGIIQAANTDSQSLTLVGSSLQISGGNSVDLSGIAGASTWADLTGTPTTLAGYGITDGGSSAWADLTGTPTTLAGYGITDGGSSAWADITDTPTTLADYGITDAVVNFADLGTTPTTLAGYGITDGGSSSWADITDTPTTLADYGITDSPADISDLTDTNGLLSGGGATVLGDLTDVSASAASTGQVLKWNGSSWAPASDSTSSGGSGISLTDLSVSNATASGDETLLEYNDVTGTFTLTSAVARTTIDDLDDVSVSTTEEGQVLTYNNTSGEWENRNIPGIPVGSTAPTSAVAGQLWYDDSTSEMFINYDLGGFFTWLQVSSVPFSGNYSDLNGAPTIPADVNELADADGLLGSGGGGGGGIALSDLSVTNQSIGSASGSLQYSAQTGVFTFIPPDISSETRSSVSVNTVTKSGGGSLTFNSSDGVFTYAPADMASAEVTPQGSNGSIQYNDNGSLGGVAGFEYDASGAGALIIGPTGGGKIKTNYWVGADNASQPMVIQSDNGSGSKATHIAFTNSSGSQTTTFSGTVDFTGNTINGLELTDLSINDGTSGQVLTTDGSGNFSFATVSGGGGGVSSYNDLTDKPTIPNDVSQLGDSNGLLAHNVYTAGTGISVDNLVVSIDSNLGDLNNVSSSAPALGQLLAWSGTQWQPTAPAAANLSSSSIGELNNVDITGVQTGQFLEWDGSKFVPASGGTVDLSTESLGDLGNVDATVPTNGDVLTWDATSSEWAPAAPASGGGGGGGSTTEYFKLNYATNGSLSSISNSTSGVSANIVDVNSGEVAVTFSGYSFPPSNVLVYGYSRTTNQYIIMPLNKDMTTRTLNAGGSPGSPIAFGSLGSLTMNLVLREADTGAGRSFGTDTHAWIVVSMI